MTAPLEIIRFGLHPTSSEETCVTLPVERQTLAKRRWRGVAENGREFGFDLESPLADGALFFVEGDASYRIAQLAEPVLEMAFANATSPQAAELGWRLGNLHFPIEITEALIRVADDRAIRQMLEREHVPFLAVDAVFHPLKGGGHRH